MNQSYDFVALTNDGQQQKGELRADSEEDAKVQVRAMGWVPLQVSESKGANRSFLGGYLWTRRKVSSKKRLTFFRQLSSLLQAKLSIERALIVLQSDSTGLIDKSLVADMLASVRGGDSLSSAMERVGAFFTASQVAAVEAGEGTGRVASVLMDLAEELEEIDQLKNKLAAALAYPGVVSIFSLVVTAFLMSTIVPQVTQAFATRDAELPWLTQAVIGVNDFIGRYIHTLLVLIFMVIVGFGLVYRSHGGRVKVEAVLLALPVWGPLMRLQNSARLATSLGMLLRAGVSAPRSLVQSAASLPALSLGIAVRGAATFVAEGASVASALAQIAAIDPRLVTYARIGEQGGSMGDMLTRVGKDMRQDFMRRCTLLTAFVEPLAVITMGLIVLIIVLSVMLPIIQMNQLIKFT